jgi:anti-sigma factor RsiW
VSASLRCAGIQRFADTYLDGEFGDRERVEFEAHLEGCETCRDKVREQAAWHRGIRDAGPHERAPAALRNRVQRAIARDAQPVRPWRRFSTRAVPLAAVGGILATLMFSKVHWSPVAADVIAKHQRNLPIEVSGGVDQLKRWYAGKVDFPVRPPRLPHAALRGGRLSDIGERQAAYLVYDVGGNKVSVFIFDPGNESLESQRKAIIDNHEVYFDQERGYNVAMYRDRGVGYAIASDLDSGQMYKLVSAAVAP